MVCEAAVGARNPALAAAAGTPAGPERCPSCRGLLDPLSRQASQNSMGPWFIRDESNPFRPGCSMETLRRLAARSRIGPDTIIRGPTTRQFWMFARNTPGVASLFGECHSCHVRVAPQDTACGACGAGFVVPEDRQVLGLGPVHLLPGHAAPETIAASAEQFSSSAPRATLLLALGIGATLLGLAALGGTAAAGWATLRPAIAGHTAPATPHHSPSPETREIPATTLARNSPADESIKTPSETPHPGHASFQVRWREHKHLAERL